MTTSRNSGVCLLCKQDVEHRFIVRHIKKCMEKSVARINSEKEKTFLFKVSDGKLFWLYLEINGSSMLDELDSFLRETWLECCGHMSAFNIKGKDYSSDGEMDRVIHRLFDVGTEFDYEYDFGSTTWLEGKVIATRPGKLQDGISLLARNHLPEIIQCSICEKHPIVICSVCYDFFCNKCKKKHKKCGGDEYMLPVVNSPRMGVCGYTGSDYE
jgi:hypothetical protein